MGQAEIETIDPITLQAVQNGMAVGKSAYQIAVDNGFVGTVQEWLASLHAVNTFPKNYKANLTLNHVTGYPDIPAPQNFNFSVEYTDPTGYEYPKAWIVVAVKNDEIGKLSEPVFANRPDVYSIRTLHFSYDPVEGADWYLLMEISLAFEDGEYSRDYPHFVDGFGYSETEFHGTDEDLGASPYLIIEEVENVFEFGEYDIVLANQNLDIPGNIAFDNGEGNVMETIQVTVMAIDQFACAGRESERITCQLKGVEGEGPTPAILSWDSVAGASYYGVSYYYNDGMGKFIYAFTAITTELSEDMWWFLD